MVMIAIGLTVPMLLAAYVLIVAVAFDHDKASTQYALVVPISYAVGSIPWGFLFTWVAKGIDIREFGSGRTGTSNVLRTIGGHFAVFVLALDLSKGLSVVLMARLVIDTPTGEVTAGLLALLGHNWPLLLGFKGGRGIATGLGGLLIMEPIAAGIGIAGFASITLFTRYLSLGSVIGVATTVLAVFVRAVLDELSATYLLYAGIGGAMIIWQHRDNIVRLLRGTERRLGQPAEGLNEPSHSGLGQG